MKSAEPRTWTSLSAEKEDKTQHREWEPPREGLADPQSPHLEATEPRMQTSSSTEKEDESYKNEVSMAGIDYNDAHLPPFPFCITLGHSCNAYPHSFRAWMQGHCYRCHHWRDKACADDATIGKSRVTCALLVPDSLLGSHKGSLMHASEHPHQCKQYISLQFWTMCEMRGSVGIEHGTKHWSAHAVTAIIPGRQHHLFARTCGIT